MEQNLTEAVTRLVFQLAVILIAAKIAAEVCERYLKVPPVLGEVAAGVIIGPFALGGLDLPLVGALFEHAPIGGGGASFIPLSTELWAIAQVAAVVLLFTVGLETDLKQFLRYAAPASIIALGGVVLPFFLGAYFTVLFGFADHLGAPEALFMGAILTATSIGITARVLSDLRCLDTPEGVTILGAAVLDDVLGILVLTIVVGISATGRIELSEVAIVGVKALGFWLALTGIGILLAKYIARFLEGFRGGGAGLALAVALALLSAGLAEAAGLAMIIGAYSIGLALSVTDLARRLNKPLGAVYEVLVPVFFVAMGMLVDLGAVSHVLVFGAVISVLAIVAKVVGCGGPALGLGFNRWGAWRVGVGMTPRGEVALIVAGVGLARGVIESDLFGVSIMMTIVTTVVAPIFLVRAFRGERPGRRVGAPDGGGVDGQGSTLG